MRMCLYERNNSFVVVMPVVCVVSVCVCLCASFIIVLLCFQKSLITNHCNRNGERAGFFFY